ncbi:MAG: ATP-binding protein [Pseudomonadota bacterium]
MIVGSERSKLRDTLAVRLSVSIGGIIFAAIMSALGFLSYLDFQSDVDAKTQAFQATAKIFSVPIADELGTRDQVGVQRVLTGIGKFPGFKFAKVVSADGVVFAEVGFEAVLQRDNRTAEGASAFSLLGHNQLWVTEDIRKSGQIIGELHLLSDISDIRQSFIWTMVINAVVAIAISVVIIALCVRAISVITRPIGRLSSLMGTFSETDMDLRLRASEDGRGEVRQLAQSFNAMVKTLEKRNRALLDYQQTLEVKVQDRTRELLVAKQEAEEANAAKSDFLATMSHEIRTPMNGMLVMAELLATAELPQKYRRYADVVMKSGSSLLSIINDVLDFSKIESGKLDVETIPVAIRPLVEDCMSLFWQQADQKGLDIACFVDGDVPDSVTGDPVRLNQVLSNLINNAIKFTDSGDVRVIVRASALEDDIPAVTISVVDTGIGIPHAKLDKVFESFTQADQTTTRKYGGTGLGLPICKRLVEAMNGTIAVESTPGHGASFHFTLPAEAIVARPRPSLHAKKRALVALPASASYHVLRDGLELSGVDILHSMEGCEAVDYVFAQGTEIAGLVDQSPGALRVAVTNLGDGDLDDLIEQGDVHDMLETPLSTYAILDLVTRLADNQPRGLSLLSAEEHVPDAILSFENKRILVADDNAVNREVIVQALRRFDVKPFVVENGLEALSLLERETVDLIFMDCSMPEMDGFQTTEIIRKRERDDRRERVPIIALTAHVGDVVSDQWQGAGMDGLVTKPFTMETLAACLKTWLATEGEPLLDIGLLSGDPVPSDTVFDEVSLGNLRDLLGDMFEMSFERLLDLYREHAPPLVVKIAQSLDEKDMKQTGDAAHALKSMAANVAAARLAAHCDHIERAAMDGQAVEARRGFDDLLAEHKRVQDAINLRLPLGAGDDALLHQASRVA